MQTNRNEPPHLVGPEPHEGPPIRPRETRRLTYILTISVFSPSTTPQWNYTRNGEMKASFKRTHLMTTPVPLVSTWTVPTATVTQQNSPLRGKPTTTRALPTLTAIRRKMPNQCPFMKKVQHQTKNCKTSSNVGHHGARQERRSCATTAAGEWPSLRTPSHRSSLIPPYVRHRTRSQIGITSSSKTYPMVTGTYATRSLPHACATEKSSN